jgi:hypothetical protein
MQKFSFDILWEGYVETMLGGKDVCLPRVRGTLSGKGKRSTPSGKVVDVFLCRFRNERFFKLGKV